MPNKPSRPTNARPPAPLRRRLSPGARRAELMACALAVFARRGLGEARHAEIAAEAGVSVATVFVYFPTREALVDAVLDEVDGFTWFAYLGGESDRALDAIVQAVNPQASCRAVATRGDERFAYEAVIDPDAPAAKEAPEIALAKISGGATFVFTPRRPVRVG
jgi:AcrR family transcriptional regulator